MKPHARLRLPRGLGSPAAIQEFLDDLPYNKEKRGETARSPRRVLETGEAHCFEGALLAAAALRRIGHRPLVVQMGSVRDTDHVLALFRTRPLAGAWGAVAKSNYSGLRFRSPVYRSLRELAMSYFDCYYNPAGEKTLRSVGRPVDLARFDRRGWETAAEDLWDVSAWLASRRFTPLVTPDQVRRLAPMDRRLYDAGHLGSREIIPEGRFGSRSRNS
jgi:hypothetical protein